MLFGFSYASPEYRKIVLENNLKVVLVSDEKYNKSSASMNVMVGSLSDPGEHQGLAHFFRAYAFPRYRKIPGCRGL